MSVAFNAIVFHNRNSVDVTLRIEAPIGQQASGPQVIPLNSTVTINPGVTDCPSVLLGVRSAADPTQEEQQTFAVAPPATGNAIFLKSLDITYIIGGFRGTVTAGTD